MFFGEIVEPSTRALIDTEFEYRISTKSPPSIKCPDKKCNLITIETPKLVNIFKRNILKLEELYYKNDDIGLEIYKPNEETYVLVYTSSKIPSGSIVELLQSWFTVIDKLYVLTASSYTFLLGEPKNQNSQTIIRTLSTNNQSQFRYENLRPPNVVSGLAADLLTFSYCSEKECTLFAFYFSSTPLDSVAVKPVVDLIKELGLTLNASGNFNWDTCELYM